MESPFSTERSLSGQSRTWAKTVGLMFISAIRSQSKSGNNFGEGYFRMEEPGHKLRDERVPGSGERGSIRIYVTHV